MLNHYRIALLLALAFAATQAVAQTSPTDSQSTTDADVPGTVHQQQTTEEAIDPSNQFQAQGDATAQEMPTSPHQAEALQEIQASFALMDTDADGQISKAEAMNNNALTEQWNTLDQNGNDTLDQDEFAQFEGKLEDTEPTSTTQPTQ